MFPPSSTWRIPPSTTRTTRRIPPSTTRRRRYCHAPRAAVRTTRCHRDHLLTAALPELLHEAALRMDSHFLSLNYKEGLIPCTAGSCENHKEVPACDNIKFILKSTNIFQKRVSV